MRMKLGESENHPDIGFSTFCSLRPKLRRRLELGVLGLGVLGLVVLGLVVPDLGIPDFRIPGFVVEGSGILRRVVPTLIIPMFLAGL